MNAGEPNPEQLLWMDLPEWADEVPEDSVFYMLEELALRHQIPLKRKDICPLISFHLYFLRRNFIFIAYVLLSVL